MSVFRVGSNKSSVNNFPSVRPTLDLDFANSKTLDPRITFTRASGGSYVGADGYIKFAGVNEARFDHDPSTGESLGLLVEEQRTNLVTSSENFSTAWAPGALNPILNTDTILNPYGVLGTVYYITVSAWVREFNANGLSTLALSFFSKRRFGGLNRDFSTIEIFQQAVGGGELGAYNFRFDGNNPNSGQFQNIRTERYQNDWYRFSCTLVARPGYNGGVFGTNARVDLEGGAADNYFWGIQVEPGAFPTSYIPTEGSTRTRAADSASITGKNFSEWYRQDEGTVLVIYAVPSFPFTNRTIFGISSSFSNRINVRLDNQNSIAPYIVTNDLITSVYALAVISGVSNSTAYTFSNNSSQSSTNGTLAVGGLQQSVSLPTCNTFSIGSVRNAEILCSTIARLTYYPKRLPDAQLQALTK